MDNMKRTVFIKREIKQKKTWREVCIGLKEDFEAPRDVYDDVTKSTQPIIALGPLQISAHMRLLSVLGRLTGW
jgi:hypothetical protein